MWVQSLGQENPLEEGMAVQLQYSCLENPHGQKNVVGYNPWGRKESDTTEQLSIYPHIARQKYRLRAADLTIFQEQRF